MKWRIFLLAFLFSVSHAVDVFSQSPANTQSQAILMIPEPVFTMGTSNRVFSEEAFGQKTFLFKLASASEWDTLASSGDPNQFFVDVGGLSNGATYQYRVLFQSELSNIVSSTQDNGVPVVSVQLPETFVNTTLLPIPHSVIDAISGGIKASVLYYRPDHTGSQNWRLVETRNFDPAVSATPASPFLDTFNFPVPDSLGDGPYEFLIVSQDTAWAPAHRPDEVFLGNEGNIRNVTIATAALKQLFVDTHFPSSEITSQLDRYSTGAAVQVAYSGEDIREGHLRYSGSGISSLSLYVNYKLDPDGPYIYSDSLYQTVTFSTPELAVNGAFNFVADLDGYYEFYTLTSDTAQNIENGGAPKQIGLPFVIVDTSAPGVDSVMVREAFSTGDTLPAAQEGWTKKPMVDYQIFGAMDIPKDGYESGLDTIRLAEDNGFSINDSSFSFTPQGLSGVYNISETAGTKDVSAGVVDAAGNSSFPVTDSIIFDPNPPILIEFEIPVDLTAENTTPVSIEAQDDFTLDSLFIWRNDTLIQRIVLPESDAFQTELTLNLPSQGNYYTFMAQVRDKAGNLSAIVSDSIGFVEVVSLNELELSDSFEPIDQFFAAAPGFANSLTVSVRLRYFSTLRKLQLATDPGFSDVMELLPPYNVQTVSDGDTTIQFDFTFSGQDGEKQLYVRGIGPQDQDTSNVLSSSIMVDSLEPLIDEISVFRVLSPGDTTFNHTNSRDIRVAVQTAEMQAAQMLIWETGLDSIRYDTFSYDTTYSLRSPDDGQIELNLVFRDLAGNWSDISSADVTLDRRLPRLLSLNFDSPFTSTRDVNINYVADDDTLFSGVGLLDRIRFSEDNQFPPETTQEFPLPMAVNDSGSFQIELLPDLTQHTVFSQVRDKAGNWSNTLSTQITLVEIVQPTALELNDITPANQIQEAAFPGWSNSDTVRVTVNYQGILARIVAARNADFTSGSLDLDSWTTIDDSTVSFEYDFGDASGPSDLYVKLIGPNLSDTSAVIQANIVIDKDSPMLSGVSLFQAAASGDTLFEYANTTSLRIRLENPTESIAYARLHESIGDTQFVDSFTAELGYSLLNMINETKMVFAAVRDSAGNWSTSYGDQIILDTSSPVISRLVLSDETIPGDEDSTLTDGTRIEIDLNVADASPGMLFRIIVAQSSDLTANPQTFIFSSGDIQPQEPMAYSLYYDSDPNLLINSEVVCFVAVDDSAQNRSNMVQDGISFSEDLRITSVLFDAGDPADSLFSATDQVRLEVREISGIFQEVAFSEDENNLSNWTPVTTGQVFSSEYNFSNADPFFIGKLYVAARNVTGQFALDSTEITVDKQAPSLADITIQANEPPGETLYTNSNEVTVSITAVDAGFLKEVHVSLDSAFETFTTIDISSQMTGDFTGLVDFEITTGNGKKTIYARVVDFAENTSPITFDDIIADFDAFRTVSNHPNPFNPNVESTIVVVKSDGNSDIEFKIYDLFGNLVREIDVPAGLNYNQIEWDGRNGKGEMVANGGYVCVIKVGNDVRTRKIAVIK